MNRFQKAFQLFKLNPWLLFKKLTLKLWPVPGSPVGKKINGVLFEFDLSFDPAIKEMYHNVYEIRTIEMLRRSLKQGDVFIDIGANIGFISALALGLVGRTGQVHSFEPVPRYFKRLRQVALANNEYTMAANQCALGDAEGRAKIAVTNLSNIGWNTIVPGLMSKETTKETIEVPVKRLDNYIKERSLSNIALIKIDTEGFEFPVLRGLSGYFEGNDQRPVIICEIAPAAYPLLGCKLTDLSRFMGKYGYRAYSLTDLTVALDLSLLKNTTNVVFVASK